VPRAVSLFSARLALEFNVAAFSTNTGYIPVRLNEAAAESSPAKLGAEAE